MDNQKIQYNIAVNTKDASDNIKTLQQQIRELKAAVDKASQADVDVIKVDGTRKSILEVVSMVDGLQARLKALDEEYLVNKNKVANKEAELYNKAAQAKIDAETKAAERIADLRSRQAADANQQWWKDQDMQRNRRTNDHQAAFESLFPNTYGNSKQRQLEQMVRQAENTQILYKQTGDPKLLQDYNAMIPTIQKLARENDTLNRSFGRSRSSMKIIGDTFRKHWGWLLTGFTTGSIIGATIGSFHDLKEIEMQFTQMATVMPSLENNQYTFNQAMKDSFALAERYGAKIEDVTKSLTLMGRQYKELSEAEKLATLALKLGTADNFSPEVATKTLEAVIGSFNKQSEAVAFGEHVVDSITKVSHNAQISANDLSEALIRSSAAAHTAGISFDELNALIAVTSRNSGLSGQDVGNMWKSVANSIHSKKAIESLQNFGVEVYKIGNDGQREFRKISDVLLDVAVKAKVSNQNVEELFKNMAGGRYQVGKLGSFMQSPDEFIRILGTSVNSSGFADKQIEYQMNTIQKKLNTLKASFEELLTIGGNSSGLTSTIKNVIDGIDRILKGLNNISPSVYSAIGTTTALVTGLLALKGVLGFVTTSYSMLRTIIVGTTTAQQTLNVVTVANPWGALARVLVMAATALGTYAFIAGGVVEAQEKQKEATENAIVAKGSEIQMIKQQSELLGTLGNAYMEAQAALVQAGDNETKATEAKRVMTAVTEQLTATVGKEAAERILASDDIMGAISEEQQVHNEKAVQMEKDLKDLKEQQITLAKDAVDASNKRIEAIVNEANNTDAAATAIEQSLGRIDGAFFRYYKGQAKYFKDTAEQLKQVASDAANNFGGGLGGAMATLGWSEFQQNTGLAADQSGVDAALARAQEAEGKAQEYADAAIAKENENKRTALAPIYTGGSFRTSPDSTGEVGTGTGGGKGKGKGKGGDGPAYAPDRQDAIAKLWANHEINDLMTKSKVATEQYEQALASLQLQQDLFGQSSVTDATKLALMADRIGGLTKETDVLMNKRMDLEKQANDLVSSHADMVEALAEKKTTWGSLSKEEKKDFVHAYLGDAADQKLAISYLENVDKITSKIAENNKKITELSSGVLLGQKNNSTAEYNRTMKRISTDEQIETLQKGPNISEEDKRVIQLKSAVEQLIEAERQLEEIKHREHSSEELQQQELAVAQLRFKVLDLKDAWKKVNEELADVLDRLLLQGESLSKIFSNLTKQLASAVLKAAITGKPVQGGGLLGDLIPKFADGGVTNRPSIFGDDGEEVAIPVEKNTGNSIGLLNYAAQKLGISNPTGVVPHLKYPNLAKEVTVNIQQSQSNEHVTELQQQTAVLKEMLNQIVNSGNNGNVTVVHTQVSDQDVLRAIQNNPSVLQSILSRNSGLRYR